MQPGGLLGQPKHRGQPVGTVTLCNVGQLRGLCGLRAGILRVREGYGTVGTANGATVHGQQPAGYGGVHHIRAHRLQGGAFDGFDHARRHHKINSNGVF